MYGWRRLALLSSPSDHLRTANVVQRRSSRHILSAARLTLVVCTPYYDSAIHQATSELNQSACFTDSHCHGRCSYRQRVSYHKPSKSVRYMLCSLQTLFLALTLSLLIRSVATVTFCMCFPYRMLTMLNPVFMLRPKRSLSSHFCHSRSAYSL